MLFLLKYIRIFSFALTALTSVPLIINYFRESEVPYEWIITLHVCFGVLFIISAIPGMILEKRENR